MSAQRIYAIVIVICTAFSSLLATVAAADDLPPLIVRLNDRLDDAALRAVFDGESVDYDNLLAHIDNRLRMEPDGRLAKYPQYTAQIEQEMTFLGSLGPIRRRELVQLLKPIIDDRISESRNAKQFLIQGPMDYAFRLGDYDFEKQAVSIEVRQRHCGGALLCSRILWDKPRRLSVKVDLAKAKQLENFAKTAAGAGAVSRTYFVPVKATPVELRDAAKYYGIDQKAKTLFHVTIATLLDKNRNLVLAVRVPD